MTTNLAEGGGSSPAQEPNAIREFNELSNKPSGWIPPVETSSDLADAPPHAGNPSMEYGDVSPADLASSPVQSGPRQLDFYDALREVEDGKQITRLDWCDPRIYLHIVQERLMIHKANSTDHLLTVQLGDMVADDWVVL